MDDVKLELPTEDWDQKVSTAFEEKDEEVTDAEALSETEKRERAAADAATAELLKNVHPEMTT